MAGVKLHHSLPVITFLVCLWFVSCQSRAEQVATAAAQAWLAVNDTGNYTQSWTGAAAYLQHAAAEKQWEASMLQMRQPLGQVLSRRKKSATETTSALGDRCVVIEYDTSFEHRRSAIETVTVMPGKDGQWQVAGYFIK